MGLNNMETQAKNILQTQNIKSQRDDHWDSELSCVSQVDSLHELEEFLATPTSDPMRNKRKLSSIELNHRLLHDFEKRRKYFEYEGSLSSLIGTDSGYRSKKARRCLLYEYEDDEQDIMSCTLDNVHVIDPCDMNNMYDDISLEEVKQDDHIDNSIESLHCEPNSANTLHILSPLDDILLLDVTSCDEYSIIEYTSDPAVHVENLLNLSFHSLQDD